tara:strand:+ start:565 stop:840 length:276 start_codon:yes stop_codon:yes gene_type:complete
MEKYIKLDVTAEGTQTLSLSNVKLIAYDSGGVDTEIFYLGGAKATLDHAANATETVRESLQNAMVALHEKNWKEVRHDFTPPIAIANIAVS